VARCDDGLRRGNPAWFNGDADERVDWGIDWPSRRRAARGRGEDALNVLFDAIKVAVDFDEESKTFKAKYHEASRLLIVRGTFDELGVVGQVVKAQFPVDSPDALESLYRSRFARLFRLVCSTTRRDDAFAMDCVHRAWMRVVQGLPTTDSLKRHGRLSFGILAEGFDLGLVKHDGETLLVGR
jgi:hypothetical protein